MNNPRDIYISLPEGERAVIQDATLRRFSEDHNSAASKDFDARLKQVRYLVDYPKSLANLMARNP